MIRFLWLAVFCAISYGLTGQGFEVSNSVDSQKGLIGETLKTPIRLKNTTDKAITLVIRKIDSQIGSSQKSYFCFDNNCLDQKIEDYLVKLEAGQSLNSFFIALEAGLVPTESSIKYIAYNKSNPIETIEFEVNFVVEEKPVKQNIYVSRHITVHDVYPNPVSDYAFVDYRLWNENAKAKIVIHNILGNVVGEYLLSSMESMAKIRTEELSAGIYFYTLYIDNEGVMTRKLIVKK